MRDVSDGRYLLLIQLQIPSFNITEGHNGYDEVSAVEFCVKLAEDMMDGDYGDGGGVGGGKGRGIW